MFLTMCIIEHNKLFKRSLSWILNAVFGAVIVLLNLISYAIVQGNLGDAAEIAEMERNLVWPAGLTTGVSVAGGAGVGGFLVIILVGAATAQEYTWGTLQQWLSRGISRPVFLTAKFAALILPTVLLVVTPLLAGGTVTALFSFSLTGRLAADQVAWGQLALDVLYTAYTLLPYAALTFLLAIATRSMVAAIGVGIAYTLMVEMFIMQMAGLFSEAVGRLALYLPAGLARSLLNSEAALQVNLDGRAAGPILLDPATAAVGIALYTLIFLALSIWIFRRQDLGR
jgi:ABC-type transport system involved in multi-copper enzyme maturation permease subunit